MLHRFLCIALALSFASVAHSQAKPWDGYYVGVTASSVTMDVEDLSFGSGPFDASGYGLGGFVGMNRQVNKLVFGFEAAMEIGEVTGNDGANMNPFNADSTISLRGRLGADAGKAMPYIVVGFSSSVFDADHDGDGNNLGTYSAKGISYGVGLDLHLNRQNNRFLRFEFQMLDYGDGVFPFAGNDNHDMTANSQRVIVGYGVSF